MTHGWQLTRTRWGWRLREIANFVKEAGVFDGENVQHSMAWQFVDDEDGPAFEIVYEV